MAWTRTPEALVALPTVSPDSVVGRLNQLLATARLKEVPDGRNVNDPVVATMGLLDPPQSASKNESRMFDELAVTAVPALKPRVGVFAR